MDISRIIAENLTRLMDDISSMGHLDTLIRVSKKSGVGFGTVRRTKNGEGNITIEKLEAIAGIFGKHAIDLLTPGLQDAKQQNTKISATEPARPIYAFKRGDTLEKEIYDLVTQLDEPGKRTLLKLAKVVADERGTTRKANKAPL